MQCLSKDREIAKLIEERKVLILVVVTSMRSRHSSRLEPVHKNVISSAKPISSTPFSEQLLMPLIYRLKGMGLRHEPWGSPLFVDSVANMLPWKKPFIILSFTKPKMNLLYLHDSPSALRIPISEAKFTPSLAADTSIARETQNSLLSLAVQILDCKVAKQSAQDLFLQKLQKLYGTLP